MKKAVTLLALASVAMSNDVEFADNNLNFFKKIGEGLKKAGQFVAQHPQIITTAVKILALEEQDDELFKLKDLIHKIEKGAEFVKDHPEIIGDGKHIAKDIKAHDYKNLIHDSIQTLKDLGFEDEELFKFKDLVHKVGDGIKKGANFVASHPAVIGDGKNIIKDIKGHNYGQLIKDGIKTYKDIKQHDDEELFRFKDLIQHVEKDVKKGIDFVHAHPQVIPDAGHIVKDIKTKEFKNLPHDIVQALKDAGFDDEELFSFKKIFESVKNGVKKGVEFVQSHPAVIGDGKNIINDIKGHNYGQLIKDGIKTFKDIKQHDDEAFNFGKVGHIVKDGVKIAKDISTHDYKHLIQDGIKTYKDIKQHDDEELFKLRDLIHDGIQIYDDVHAQPRNIGNIVNDVIKTIKDIKQHDDDELFHFKDLVHKVENGVKKGAEFVHSHPQVIGDAGHLIKDAKNHDLKSLIKDGIKTYKDIKQHDDDELFNIGKVGNLIKDGAHIVKDVKTHDVKNLIKDGVKTFHDIKQHDDDELFNIKDVVHKVENGVKKGVEFVGSHPQVIPDAGHLIKDAKTKNVGGFIHDGVKLFKDLGFEDQTDNALFSLGDLIHDGMNIAKDIKSHDYGNLVNHGIQTVKDLKNKDKKFLF